MDYIKIRKAESIDLKDIAAVINMLRLDIKDFVWNTPEFLGKQIKNGEYFLAKKNGKTAGIISLHQRGKKMYIETLAVVSECRFQKIGTQLVDFAKNFTKERGLNNLFACSFFEYKIGNFYTNQGFLLLDKPGMYNGHKYHIFLTHL